MPGIAKRAGGFALLIVLWALGSLSTLFTQIVADGRSEAEVAVRLRSSIVQELDADGAIHAAAFHLLDRADRHWEADGTTHQLKVAGGSVAVQIVDESNKVNLNTASADLLRALLLGVGVDPGIADALASAIVDWRGATGPEASATKQRQYRAAGLDYAPPEKPFRSIDEVRLVIGMSAGLMARITPHLTIYSTYGPGRNTPDSVVLGAIMRLRTQGGVLPFEHNASAERVVEVIAVARGPDGARFARRAILRVEPGAKERPWDVLLWDRQ